jgi:preprotein translocase SecF subunit
MLPAECPPEARPTELAASPGGDKIDARYDHAPDLSWIRQRMIGVTGVALRDGSDNPVLTSAREHRVEIQLKAKGDQILDGLRADLGSDVAPDRLLRSEWVGPKAGAQLRNAALESVAVAFAFIMLYIALRFDLRFAPGAVLAVAHDAIVTGGVLLALGKEINLTVVAALLTVVGYSTNDKVVIYDRIRENMHKLRGTSFGRLINVSLSGGLRAHADRRHHRRHLLVHVRGRPVHRLARPQVLREAPCGQDAHCTGETAAAGRFQLNAHDENPDLDPDRQRIDGILISNEPCLPVWITSIARVDSAKSRDCRRRRLGSERASWSRLACCCGVLECSASRLPTSPANGSV